MNFDIDFVVLWVDGSDSEWIKSFNSFLPEELSSKKIDVSEERYRDAGLLKYWFRGVEKCAPWVRKIHFVTCGQKPEWLNTDNPKLHLVNHSDYIDSKYLPLFNSEAIEISMHKIPDLAEHFVYFNDDFFLTNPIKPEYYFGKNGQINDSATFSAPRTTDYSYKLISNELFINENFKKSNAVKIYRQKFLNLKYRRRFFENLFYIHNDINKCFLDPSHYSQPFTKSIFEEVWNCGNKTKLIGTLSNRFRSPFDVNQYIFREWALLSGNFNPSNNHKGRNYFGLDRNIDEICNALLSSKFHEIVINDRSVDNYNEKIEKIKNTFEKKFPNKSGFEK